MATIKEGRDTKQEILEVLQKKDKLRVVELAKILNRATPTVSKNLRQLRKQEKVEFQREEVKIYWRKK